MHSIYSIRNNVTGKYYVGRTQDIDGRWYQHRVQSSNIHLRNDFREYGIDKFTFRVEETGIMDKDTARRRENHFIEILNAFHPLGYTIASNGGKYISQSHEIGKLIKATLKARRKSMKWIAEETEIIYCKFVLKCTGRDYFYQDDLAKINQALGTDF